jgi:hypothetical protein
MDRRGLLFALAATVVVRANPLVADASPFLNGELNHSARTFDWSGGGNDSLRTQWTQDGFQQTLAISRLNLDHETQRGLRNVLLGAPQARVNLSDLEGRVIGDVMVSGAGWLATRPRVFTRRWRRGRTTMASWYTWTNRRTGERWEMYVPDVCNNLVLTRLGQPVPCVCGVEDACV